MESARESRTGVNFSMKPTINSWPLKSRHIFDYYRHIGLDLEVPFHLTGEGDEEVCKELKTG